MLSTATSEVRWLAEQTRDFRVRALSEPYDPRDNWGQIIAGAVARSMETSSRVVQTCIDDHWPTTFLRCYVEQEDRWACARRELPIQACLDLEHALWWDVDHPPSGFCGEPRRRYY